MQVWIDLDGQVVFFTPRGRALFDVPSIGPPSAGPAPGRPADGRPAASEPPQLPGLDDDVPWELRPGYRSGASRWKRDYDVPWAVEARAWEALDSEPLDSEALDSG